MRKRLNAVIDSFFALDDDGKHNRMKWLDVPQDRIKAGAGGTIQLVNEQVPVPARELFDKAISTVVGEDTDISIETFFKQMGIGALSGFGQWLLASIGYAGIIFVMFSGARSPRVAYT